MSPKVLSAEESIVRTVEQFTESWNARDAKRLASAFADDADYITASGGWWRGRHEIAEQAARHPGGLVLPRNVSIRFLRADVAVIQLSWESPGGAGPGRRGIMTFLSSRQDGRWVFDSAQNTELIVD